MSERWLPVPGAPDYAVSDHGRVIRRTATMKTPAGHILAQQKRGARRQYAGVDLRAGGKRRAFYVHQLVAMVFIGERPSKRHEVAHGDGNPRNNCVGNLRWSLPTDNHADKLKHGTLAWGERNAAHRLTADQVREIRTSAESAASLAKKFGVTAGHAQEIRRGEHWAHLKI